MSVLLRDTFTGADGTLLTAHPMDVGGGWTFNGTGNIGISGNRAVQSGVSFNVGAIAHADAGVSDNVLLSLAVRLTGVGDTGGVVLRWNGLGYAVQLTSSSLDVLELEPTQFQFTLRARTPVSPALGVDHVLTAQVSGTVITGALDGGASVSYGQAANNPTVTRFGLLVASLAQLDDFQLSVPVPGPYRLAAGQVVRPGAVAGQAFGPGAVTGQTFRPGAAAGQVAGEP